MLYKINGTETTAGEQFTLVHTCKNLEVKKNFSRQNIIAENILNLGSFQSKWSGNSLHFLYKTKNKNQHFKSSNHSNPPYLWFKPNFKMESCLRNNKRKFEQQEDESAFNPSKKVKRFSLDFKLNFQLNW